MEIFSILGQCQMYYFSNAFEPFRSCIMKQHAFQFPELNKTVIFLKIYFTLSDCLLSISSNGKLSPGAMRKFLATQYHCKLLLLYTGLHHSSKVVNVFHRCDSKHHPLETRLVLVTIRGSGNEENGCSTFTTLSLVDFNS